MHDLCGTACLLVALLGQAQQAGDTARHVSGNAQSLQMLLPNDATRLAAP
jgi:hypothetical protein